MLEMLIAVAAVYITLLLILEAVIWKAQPNMEGGVTLFVKDKKGNLAYTRKLYGFDFEDKLYVSSNHWFRQWYHAILANPQLDVEHAGEVKACTAVPVDGDERVQIAHAYKMGWVLRLMCGFAPRRFIRLDPRDSDDEFSSDAPTKPLDQS